MPKKADAKKAYLDALNNLLDNYTYKEIYVNMIADKTSFARKTFYDKFSGKDDLIKYAVECAYDDAKNMSKNGFVNQNDFIKCICANPLFKKMTKNDEDKVKLYTIMQSALENKINTSFNADDYPRLNSLSTITSYASAGAAISVLSGYYEYSDPTISYFFSRLDDYWTYLYENAKKHSKSE